MLRRVRPFLSLSLLAAVLACNTLVPRPTPTTLPPTPVFTPTAAPTATAAPSPTAAMAPTAGARADLYITSGDVLVHPDPQIYSGDKVSFEIFAHDGAGLGLRNFSIALYHGAPSAADQVAAAPAQPYGLGDRLEGSFVWAWDTTGLVGEQTLTAVLNPDNQIARGDENKSNNRLTFTVNVLPRSAMPASEAAARWATASSICCIFHYITGSAAERDIQSIIQTADASVAAVEARLGRRLKSKIEFNLINRLLGHGGFASETVTISYLDRDGAGGGLDNVLRHETTHILDRQLGDNRPSLIEEGFATYVAGGHFKAEPFQPRLTGLLALNGYIPLKQLANDFYDSQHETGYLEGAALIDYLTTTYGWKKFITLMGAFHSAESQSVSLDAGLRFVYDKPLAQIETDFLAQARSQPVDPRWQTDVELTLAYYNSLRRYQQADDPSAYFLTAWTPDINKAVTDNIVADYNRHPDQPVNIALEALLVDANQALAAGDYPAVRTDLAAVNAVLDARGDFAASPLAERYLAVTQTLLNAGYEAQRIAIHEDHAAVAASPAGQAQLVTLTLVFANGVWRMN
jgi:hypothetical protein